MREPAPPRRDRNGRRDRIAENVSAERLMAHIREFSKRIKLSGSPEERESFLYLRSQMADLGYRTELLQHDAFISLPLRARVEVDGRPIRSITHSMSVSTPEDGLSATLVYVGEGESRSFEERDVRGKVVLVDGIATEEVAARASSAGAVAQIHISPNENLYEMCVSPVWGSPSQHTRKALPTTAIFTIDNSSGAELRERWLRGETVRPHLTAEVDTGWRKTPLLVAELEPPGSDAETPFVLFSGHHDTWHYGVMDNGGANATMLEAARVLATQRSAWRRGLRICFWSGHSHGRYSGSAWYADEFWSELESRCAAHVNVDSTGGKGATVLTNSGVVDELKGVAADAVRTVAGQVHAGRRQGRAADQSFWGVGVPSMFGSVSHQPPGPVKMLTALGWWWHTPFDLADRIDPDNLVRDTKIAIHVLASLLTGPVLPLDYQDVLVSLASELKTLESSLRPELPIDGLFEAMDRLAAKLHDLAREAKDVSGQDARRFDRALMRVSRALVPLNYTTGERFHHDPALPQPPWPSLDGMRELARLDSFSSDRSFYVVHARRTRNRIAAALHRAEEAIAACLRQGADVRAKSVQ